MNKLFSIATTLLLLLITTSAVFGQTTVDIVCTGTSNSTNPWSGRITDSNTRSYGYLQWNNNVGGCPTCRAAWARFDLGSNIPSNATITAASLVFYVESKTFSSQESNRLRVFNTNPATTTYATMIGANHGSFDNIPVGWNVQPINAAGIALLQTNITSLSSVAMYKTAFNGSYFVHGSNGVGASSTNAIVAPILRITYTLPCTSPTVAATTAATSIGCTTATTGGNVTGDGGCAVTERGVVYSISPTVPTTSNSKVTAAGTTGTFTSNLTGLTPNTTYIVRAYATNTNGTTYGTQISFTTLPPPGQPTDITPTIACAGSATVFTTSATNSPTSYTWTLPSGWTGSSSTASITATPNSTSGSISVTATNACGTSAVRTTAITLSVPVAPTVNTITNP